MTSFLPRFIVAFSLFLLVTFGSNVVMAAQSSESSGSCLNLKDHYETAPILLKGKLVVTYMDQTIDKSKGDIDELGVFLLDRKEFRQLSHDLVNEAEVDISPSGKKFLYTVRPRRDDFKDLSEIWEMNIDGTDPVRLVSGRSMGVPAWNPNGKQFLFIEWGGDLKGSRFFTYDFATKGVTPFLPQLENPADPEFSYDGRLITFKMPVKGDRDFQPSIYVMNADGSNLRRLTRGFSDHDPVFSRDGKKIYFERYYGPGNWFQGRRKWWGIVEVDVKTRQEKIIVPYDPCERHIFWLPTISPDGRYLMYIHNNFIEKPGSDLWVSDINGHNAQKVRGSDWFYFFDWTK
jgi:Tol biopolymer transport system component